MKALPDEFAADASRLARFQIEAEALAALNHPHIAGIHDIAEAGGARYLVLELVEGETLAERIKGLRAEGSGLPIADALEAAHEKGIIHRDLKPTNIKITPDGRVKVLDFGLAKMREPDGPSVGLTNSPTLVSRLTKRRASRPPSARRRARLRVGPSDGRGSRSRSSRSAPRHFQRSSSSRCGRVRLHRKCASRSRHLPRLISRRWRSPPMAS